MAIAPDLAAVKTYLGDASSWTDAQITEALKAETAAQARVVRLPLAFERYPADLAEALMRRVQRNLTLRGLPLGLASVTGETTVVTTRIGTDPEVRRLEAPWRRNHVG